MKLEVTDMNCNTCEVIECFSVDLMTHNFTPNQICDDNENPNGSNSPFGDPIDIDIGIFNPKPIINSPFTPIKPKNKSKEKKLEQ